MTQSYVWIGSVLIAAAVPLVFLWLQHRRAMEDARRRDERFSEEIGKQESACSERVAELKRDLKTLEMNMQTAEEVLRDGRLSRSSRSQAMRLLRSGVTPETAASTLGVAKNEMRLLARVSAILNAP